MLIDIEEIKITDRIRKDFGDILELADDIQENGLINPPVVTPEYELIAGERRLRAMKQLGYKQVEVRVMSVKDAEHQLNLEISENETRKDFSKKERIDYAKRLERIEKVKAEIRSGMRTDLCENFPTGGVGRTTDIVASKLGIGSGKQYEKEKYIVDNADTKTLEQWDNQEISTNKAYLKIKADKEKAEQKVKSLEKEKAGLEKQNKELIELQKLEHTAINDNADSNELNIDEKTIKINKINVRVEDLVTELSTIEYFLDDFEELPLESKNELLKHMKALNKLSSRFINGIDEEEIDDSDDDYFDFYDEDSDDDVESELDKVNRMFMEREARGEKVTTAFDDAVDAIFR